MTVYDAYILDPQFLENKLRNKKILQSLLEGMDKAIRRSANEGNTFHDLLDLALHPHIARVEAKLAQVCRHGPDIAGNRHAVVIEYYYKILMQMPGLIQGFERHSAAERSVPYH